MPHHCSQSHQSNPSFKDSVIQTLPPYPPRHYTSGPHCPRHDAPTIAYNNKLASILALCQAIHRWAHLTLPLLKVPQVTTPHPTHTQRRSVMHPMRRPETFQPHSLLPRVVIQTPNAALSAPRLTSSKEKYDPVA